MDQRVDQSARDGASQGNPSHLNTDRTSSSSKKGIALALGALLGAWGIAAGAEDSAWVKIFNGTDLEGWTHYWQHKGISNPANMFHVTPEGYFEVNITENYADVGYGHSFYTKKKLSYYMVRSIYRFPANMYGPGWGQGWNRENNGLMLHSQAPETMNGKDFPESIEVQLLGKNNEQNPGQKSQGFKYATNANLCTPGTYVAYNGVDKYETHCTAAQYPAAWKNTETPFEDPEGWTDVTVRVLSDSLVQHFIHGQKVFEYTKLRKDNGQRLTEGFLSIQAEGTTTQFRSIEVLELTGCMDQESPSYRSYFVKNDASTCAPATRILTQPWTGSFSIQGSVVEIQSKEKFQVELHALDGRRLASKTGEGNLRWQLPVTGQGIYFLHIFSQGKETVRRIAVH
jgi:hypothetical protein